MVPLIDIHTHNPHSEGIAVYSHRMGIGDPLPPRPFSEGIHPWDVSAINDPSLLVQELRTSSIVAVGEIGIDRLHGNIPLQKELFRKQLTVALERDLPVIVHCVRSFEDVMHILLDIGHNKIIWHGYIGSEQQTKRIRDAGHYISIGDTSLRSGRTLRGLKNFPHGKLFLETDASGLTIENVYERASLALGTPIERIADEIYSNYKELFGL